VNAHKAARRLRLICALGLVGLAAQYCVPKKPEFVRYSISPTAYRYTTDDVFPNAFEKRVYPSAYDRVRAAAIEVLSQRGVIVGLNSGDGTVIALSHGKYGAYFNTIVAVGIRRIGESNTEVRLAWVRPGTEKCAVLTIDKSKPKPPTTPGKLLTPLESSQYAALEVGGEFLEQLGTHLYGIEKWRGRYLKNAGP